jgi:hypothetical protein
VVEAVANFWVTSCAWCGLVRDRNRWVRAQVPAGATVTHSICPDCLVANTRSALQRVTQLQQ